MTKRIDLDEKIREKEYEEFNEFIDNLIIKCDNELVKIEKILNKIEREFEKMGYKNISRENILRYLDII